MNQEPTVKQLVFTFTQGQIKNLQSDVKNLEKSAKEMSTSTIGTTGLYALSAAPDRYLTKQQADKLFGGGWWEASPADKMARFKNNTDVKFNGIAIATYAAGAEAAAGRTNSLYSQLTSKTTLRNDPRKALQMAVVAGLAELDSGEETQALAKKVGLDVFNPNNATGQIENVVSHVIYNGIAARGGSFRDIMNSSPIRAYAEFMGTKGGDPYYRAMKANIENVQDTGTYEYETNATQGIKRLDSLTSTDYYVAKFVDGSLILQGARAAVVDPLRSKESKAAMTSSLKMALMEESNEIASITGENPMYNARIGMAINLTSNVLDMLAISYLTAGIGAYAKAATVVGKTGTTVTKAAKLGKGLKTVAKVASLPVVKDLPLVSKGIIAELRDSGYGMSTRFDLIDENVGRTLAGFAFDLGTLEVSRLGTNIIAPSVGGFTARSMARDFANKNISGMLKNVARHNIAYAASDIIADTALDVAAHRIVEQFVSDPFSSAQERMTSLIGEERTSPAGLAQQVMYRFATRSSMNVIRKLGMERPKAALGSEEWRVSAAKDMGLVGDAANKGKALARFNGLTSALFSNNLSMIESQLRMSYPELGPNALGKYLAISDSPYKAYMTLWKMAETQTNDMYMLFQPKKKLENLKKMKALTSIRLGHVDLMTTAEMLNIGLETTGAKLETATQKQAFSRAAAKYIVGDGTNSTEMVNRRTEVLAYLRDNVKIDDPEMFVSDITSEIGRQATSMQESSRELLNTKKLIENPQTDEEKTENTVISNARAKAEANISAIEQFASDLSRTSIKDLGKVIDYSTFGKHMISLESSDKDLSGVFAFKVNDETMGKLRRLSELSKQELDRTTEYLNNEQKETIANLEATINDPKTSDEDKKTAQYALDHHNRYRAFMSLNTDKGIELVSDFLGKVVNPQSFEDIMSGNAGISGDPLVDMIAAAKSLAKAYNGAIELNMNTDLNNSPVFKQLDEKSVNTVLANNVAPFIDIINTFGHRFDQATIEDFKDTLRKVEKASLSAKASKAAKVIQNYIPMLESMQEATLARKEIASSLSGLHDYVEAVSMLRGYSNPLIKFAIHGGAVISDYAEIDIVDGDGVNYGARPIISNIPGVIKQAMLDDIPSNDRVLYAQSALAFAASKIYAQQLMVEMLANKGTSDIDKINKLVEKSVASANHEIKNVIGDSVVIKSVQVSEDSNPRIEVEFNLPKTDTDLKMLGASVINSLSMNSKLKSDAVAMAFNTLDAHAQNIRDKKGRYASIEKILSDMAKVNPNTLAAIRAYVISSLAISGDVTPEMIANVRGIVSANTPGILSKFSDSTVDAIAYKLVGASLQQTDVVGTYSIGNQGLGVTLTGERFLSNIRMGPFSIVYADDNLSSTERLTLTEHGFIPVSHKGAGATSVYIKVPSLEGKTESEKASYLIGELHSVLTDQANRYSYGSLSGATHSWSARVAEDVLKYMNSTDKAADLDTQLKKVIDIMGKAYFDFASDERYQLRGKQFDDELTFNIGSENSPLRLKPRNLIMHLVDSGFNKIYQDLSNAGIFYKALPEIVNVPQAFKVMSPEEYARLTLDQSALDGMSSRLTAGLNNLSASVKSYANERIKSLYEDFETTAKGISETIGQKLQPTIEAITELESKHNKLMRGIQEEITSKTDSEYLSTFIARTLTTEQVEAGIRQYLSSLPDDDPNKKQSVSIIISRNDIEAIYSQLRKAAYNKISAGDIEKFKLGNTNELLSNIAMLATTRGSGFGLGIGELQKRMGSMTVGRTTTNQEAEILVASMKQLMVNKVAQEGMTISTDDVRFRIVIDPSIDDGAIIMAPEIMKALSTLHGSSISAEGKLLYDFTGGLVKSFTSISDVGTREGNDYIIRMSPDTIKLLSPSDAKMLLGNYPKSKQTSFGSSITTDTTLSKTLSNDEAHLFFKGVSRHAQALDQVKTSSGSSQDIINSWVSRAQGLDAGPSQNSISSGPKSGQSYYEAVYETWSSRARQSGNPRLMTAVVPINNKTVPGVDLARISAITPGANPDNIIESLKHGLGTPPGQARIGITKLASLAAETLESSINKNDQKIKRIIDEIYEAETKLVNLSKEDLANYSRALVEFISDSDGMQFITKGLYKDSNGTEADVYFIGLQRSPSPGSTHLGLFVLDGILNVREGNNIQVNNAMIKGARGDFDGDAIIGFGLTKKNLVRSLAIELHGDDSDSSNKKVSSYLANAIFAASAKDIRTFENTRFLGLPVGLSKDLLDAIPTTINEEYTNMAALMSTMIQNDIVSPHLLKTIVENRGAMRSKVMSPYVMASIIEAAINSSKDAGLVEGVTFKPRASFVDSFEGGDRLVYYTGLNKGLFGSGAVGSTQLIKSVDLADFGNNKAAALVQSYTHPSGKVGHVITIATNVNAFASKVIGHFYYGDESAADVHIKAGMLARMSPDDIINDSGFTKEIGNSYVQTLEAGLIACQASFDTPKDQSLPYLYTKYGGGPEALTDFTHDLRIYESESIAASILPLAFHVGEDDHGNYSTPYLYGIAVDWGENNIRTTQALSNSLASISREAVVKIADKIKPIHDAYISVTKYSNNPDQPKTLYEINRNMELVRQLQTVDTPRPIVRAIGLSQGYQIPEDSPLSHIDFSFISPTSLFSHMSPVVNMHKMNYYRDVENFAIALDKLLSTVSGDITPEHLKMIATASDSRKLSFSRGYFNELGDHSRLVTLISEMLGPQISVKSIKDVLSAANLTVSKETTIVEDPRKNINQPFTDPKYRNDEIDLIEGAYRHLVFQESGKSEKPVTLSSLRDTINKVMSGSKTALEKETAKKVMFAIRAMMLNDSKTIFDWAANGWGKNEISQLSELLSTVDDKGNKAMSVINGRWKLRAEHILPLKYSDVEGDTSDPTYERSSLMNSVLSSHRLSMFTIESDIPVVSKTTIRC